ncbi:hypothetical protein [Nocardia asteroides]|uniref:hypothetical protein n=1 Tax=Nocardia asteroides TaxID=1824 RepID=UPI00343C4348
MLTTRGDTTPATQEVAQMFAEHVANQHVWQLHSHRMFKGNDSATDADSKAKVIFVAQPGYAQLVRGTR